MDLHHLQTVSLPSPPQKKMDAEFNRQEEEEAALRKKAARKSPSKPGRSIPLFDSDISSNRFASFSERQMSDLLQLTQMLRKPAGRGY